MTALNLSNVSDATVSTLVSFINSFDGVTKVPARIKKEAALTIARSLLASVQPDEPEVNNSLVTEYEGAFAFPNAASAEAFASFVANATGETDEFAESTSVQTYEADTESEGDEENSDESTDEENSDEAESDEDEAARIEAEARADEAVKAKARVRASNSAGVAASWANPETRAKRLIRDSVTVERVTEDEDGEPVISKASFRSTREAFRFYSLPDSVHIRFRLKLKASRDEVFTSKDGSEYRFRIEAVEGDSDE